MKRQHVDVVIGNNRSFCGDDSEISLIHSCACVIGIPPFTRACLFFITLTFRALGRNHIVSTPFQGMAMLCFSTNSGIAPARASSELIVHCTGKSSKSIPCRSIATKREYIRLREASSSVRAAQILRQGPLDPIPRAIFCPRLQIKLADFPYLLSWPLGDMMR